MTTMSRYFPLVLLLVLLLPVGAFAQTATTTVATTTPALELAGWIPYWRVSEGTRDARTHLEVLDVLHPFAFSVQADGKIKDLAGLTKYLWTKLFRDARAQGVLVVPTVMWSDTNAMSDILLDPAKRALHVSRIVALVKKGKYDGIDIDYEGKRASTKDAYSAFLGELKTALGDKLLSCTIEARTPPESLYLPALLPATMEYANDYGKLNEYCDRVNIMAYDQQRADILLNKARTGMPYYPVADVAWVRKVVELALKDIAPEKLVLSVPTYGREVSLTVAPDWYKSYSSLWSVSQEYALDTAKEYGVTPVRNSAEEQSFSYVPKDSVFSTLFSSGTGDVASRALAYASATGKTVSVNLVWWSDAEAIATKVALAKELGLRGISLFKIDGAEDPAIWELF